MQLIENAFTMMSYSNFDSNEYKNLLKRKLDLLSGNRKYLLDVGDLRKKSPMKIESVIIMDSSGNQKFNFLSNEDIIVKISCQTKLELTNIVVGIGIYNDQKLHISGPNTKHYNKKISHVSKSLDIDFIIKKNQITDGAFLLTISIHDEDSLKPYDIHEQSYAFSIKKSSNGVLGPIMLDCGWKIKYS